jgi:hypothetical protein
MPLQRPRHFRPRQYRAALGLNIYPGLLQPLRGSAVQPESFCLQMSLYPGANIRKGLGFGRRKSGTAGQTRQARLTSSLEQCRLRGRIGDRCSLDMGKRRELVVAVIGGGEDFDDSNAAHAQRVGHQRPMAAPRHRFGAHDRCALLTAQSDQLVEAVRKFLRLHVIGIAAKARVPPAGVGGVLAGASQTAQRAQGGIFDAMRLERFAQRISVELRVMARPRHRADIDEAFDAVALQQRYELLQRARRVAYGVYRPLRPVHVFRSRALRHGVAFRVSSIGP